MKYYLASYSGWLNYIQGLPVSKFILESFVEGEKKCLTSLQLVGNENFMLDSGAFTMMQQKKKGQVKFNLNEYKEQYIEFVNKNKIKYFFNLDLERVIGIEETKKITKEINYKCHARCIQVFHKELGLEYYKKLVQEEDYIAIGTISDFKKHYPILKQLAKIARDNNCKIHGLGFTPQKVTEGIFNSVDSTSWKKDSIYGSFVYFSDNNMKKMNQNRRVKLCYKDLIRHNYQEYLKFQNYLIRVGE